MSYKEKREYEQLTQEIEKLTDEQKSWKKPFAVVPCR